MKILANLATSALLGTERRPPDWPQVEEPIGALLERIPREPVEKAVLQVAGVLGSCQLAGVLPPEIEPALSPSPQDSLPRDGRVDLLAQILEDGPERLQAEAFRALMQVNHVLPHRLLPKALECGRRSNALRAYLYGIVGERGAWLAAQNEDWKWAAGARLVQEEENVWDHGTIFQRSLFLAELRRNDPARARELALVSMTSEGPKERAAFIDCMETGLSLEDQDLLEVALADKIKEVRQSAARLLSRLPASRFGQRMGGRLAACVKAEKKLLRGTVVTLEPPAAYDASWKADLVEETKPKNLSMGERAWWLYQIVRYVPLEWWETHTGLKPAELLAWGVKSDWKDALIQGWTEAQSTQRLATWAEAFLDSPAAQGQVDVFNLLKSLSPAQRENKLLWLLSSAASNNMPASSVLDRFIKDLPLNSPMLSHATAVAVIRYLKERIHKGEAKYDWQLRAPLAELSCIVPVSAFEEFAQGWELTKEEAQPFAEAIARVGIILDQRRQLAV